MYSSRTHSVKACKKNFFYKSKCCWTYRTVAPRQSRRLMKTLSHFFIRQLGQNSNFFHIQSCNNVQQQWNLHRSTTSRFEPRTLENCGKPGRFRSTSHKTIYTARQSLRIFLYLLYHFLLYRVTRDY